MRMLVAWEKLPMAPKVWDVDKSKVGAKIKKKKTLQLALSGKSLDTGK